MVDNAAATFAAALRNTWSQPSAEPGSATPATTTTPPWFQLDPGGLCCAFWTPRRLGRGNLLGVQKAQHSTPALVTFTVTPTPPSRPALGPQQGMLNSWKTVVGHYLDQTSDADMHACLQRAISELRSKRASKGITARSQQSNAKLNRQPHCKQGNILKGTPPTEKKTQSSGAAGSLRAPETVNMKTTEQPTTTTTTQTSVGVPSSEDATAGSSSHAFSTDVEKTAANQDAGGLWTTVLSRKATKRARLSAHPVPKTGQNSPGPKARERYVVTLRPRSKIDVTALPKRGLMEAITCPLGVKPEIVSIKTTKESNTITVLTEYETTKRALLAIKEIQITDQQPLAVQAYEAIGDCQIRGVIYMIDKEEDNASLLAGLQSNGPAVLAARPMSSGSRTGLITFQGPHLPRTVWYRRNVLQVYPYRPRAVTCSNCHKIGHKQDICPEPQVCSTCGKPHEETMDDQGQVTCPSPIPFCQMCRKNGHLATDKYCSKRIDIVRRIRETARKRAAPLKNPGSSKPTKLVFQAKQKGGRRSTPPNPPAPTPTPPAPTATVDQVLPTMQGLFQVFMAIAAQMSNAMQRNPNPQAWHNRPQERPDAYLLQEVNCTTIKLNGYKSDADPSVPSVRADRVGQAMIYLHRDWPQHQVNLQQWCTKHQEVVAEPRDHGWITHLDVLYPGEQKIVGGDFNLQHTAWGYARDTSAGRDLMDEMVHHRYTLMNIPGEKTRLSSSIRQDHTTPDLTWTNNPHTTSHTWKPEADTRGSDHLPIRIGLALTGPAALEPGKRLVRVVNWDIYRNRLKNSKTSTLCDAIKEAIAAATTKKLVKLHDPTPDLHLLNLWARRLRALQRYRRGPKNARALREVTRATIEARKYAEQLTRQRWLDFSASLSEKTSIRKLWAVSRAMLGRKRDLAATLTLALTTNKAVETLAQEAGDTLFRQPTATNTVYRRRKTHMNVSSSTKQTP
ncbi:hypothetical protein HPB47_020859 [Ixodes persulcatus]|uniref:Uncharacterized protein n=1 Tax=Ixodes persulcatus TaxID=34615 RepID=A0AC60QEE6_IXOPE|nr:hypothetical protein HPB47_020859 [Ixodes persulcatus]